MTLDPEHGDTEPQGQPAETQPRELSRRAALKVLGAVPLAGAVVWQQQQQQGQQAPRQTHEAPNQPAADTKRPPRAPQQRRFFNARETRTMRALANDIIPRDERSGNATDAGVIAFLEHNLASTETSVEMRTQWRGGLRWIDSESRKRFGVVYAEATPAQRHQILDDIAYPDRVRPEFRHGAAFFARARDMVAAGFFSSAIGVKDLQYLGNTAMPTWNGCPEPALRKLGVSYDLMNTADTQ